MGPVALLGHEKMTLSPLVYYFVSFLSLWIIGPLKTIWGETNFPPLLPHLRLVIIFIYLNLAAAYLALGKRRTVPGIDRRPERFLWLLGITAFLFCFMAPVFSGDIREYLMKGRILSVYHASPYLHIPQEFSSDLVYPLVAWRRTLEVYGPLAVILEAIPPLIFPNSVEGMIFCYKLFTGAFLILAVLFFYKIVLKLKGEEPENSFRLFALNPLFLVATLVDGHNEVMLLALAVMAVYFLLEKQYTRCFIFWTLAFLIKYSVILILPFLFLLAVKQKRTSGLRWGGIIRLVLGQVILIAALVLLAYWPLAQGANIFQILYSRTTDWFYSNTFPYLLREGLSRLHFEVSKPMMQTAFTAVFGAWVVFLFFRYAIRKGTDLRLFFRSMALIYLGGTFYTTSPIEAWHLLWALPWLILSEWPLSPWLVTLYSFAGLFAFSKRINFLLILAATLYLLGLWVVSSRSRHQVIPKTL